jgi:hypothetical protein
LRGSPVTDLLGRPRFAQGSRSPLPHIEERPWPII